MKMIKQFILSPVELEIVRRAIKYLQASYRLDKDKEIFGDFEQKGSDGK